MEDMSKKMLDLQDLSNDIGVLLKRYSDTKFDAESVAKLEKDCKKIIGGYSDVFPSVEKIAKTAYWLIATLYREQLYAEALQKQKEKIYGSLYKDLCRASFLTAEDEEFNKFVSEYKLPVKKGKDSSEILIELLEELREAGK